MGLFELKAKDKNKVFNAGVVILALIVAFNIYQRQLKAVELLKQKKELEIKKSAVLEDLSQLEKKIASYKQVLTEKDASLVMNTITNIAKESGIKIVSIRPEDEKDYPDYVKFPFSLIVSTPSYHLLGKFISKLESYKEMFFIVEATEIKPENENRELTANIRINTIAYKD